jgi:hypothetical protein
MSIALRAQAQSSTFAPLDPRSVAHRLGSIAPEFSGGVGWRRAALDIAPARTPGDFVRVLCYGAAQFE